MQNLAQIIDANGIQVERVPIEGTRQVPSEPNEYQKDRKSVV